MIWETEKNLLYHSTLSFMIDKEPTNTCHKAWQIYILDCNNQISVITTKVANTKSLKTQYLIRRGSTLHNDLARLPAPPVS